MTVTFADIEAAQGRIAGQVDRTPARYSRKLSQLTGAEVWVKFDNLHFTGSFKERGALNRLLMLTPEERKRGVVAASAGNHALALAWHARDLGIPVTVVMPKVAPLVKQARCRELGARVLIHGANIAEAKKYMEAAGYPNGFTVTLDCPNNRYINDEQICQAVVGMLAQIGIRVTLNAMPLATYFPKIGNRDTSFFLLGWGVPTYDAHYSLQLLLQTTDGTANGQWNYTGYSSARFDALVNRMTTELDTKARDAMAKEALQIAQNDLPYIPLHHQVLVWGLRQPVDMPITPNNQPRFQWATVR
jgi:hypothetical protein